MATPTLQSLLAAPDLATIRTKLLGYLQGKGLPTTDWSSTGYELTIVEMVARALQDFVVNGRPITVGGCFVDYANHDWLSFNSQQRYNNPRNPANFTLGNVLLANSTGSNITIQPNQLWFLFPSGNRYNGPIGAGPWVVPAHGTLSIPVQSESPNHSVATSPTDTDPLVNYIDASGAAIQMVVSVAGITATNPAPTFSTVTLNGLGSGTVTPGGSPGAPHNVAVRVDQSGQVGGALIYSYSLDGGAWVTGLTATTQTNIGGSGVNFTVANGSGTPSFIAGAVYSFSVPGTWITSQGTDEEYDVALQSRDKNRWPSLATLAAIPGSPTLGFYDLLVRQVIPPATSSQVTQTLVLTDPKVNNKVNIYVAGQGGVLPPAEITKINNFLASLNMLTDFPLAQSPTPLTITLGGLTITVKQAALFSAQVALQVALANYFASAGINASAYDGKLKHGRIVQIIEDIFGVVDVTDTTMTINAVAASLVLPTTPGLVQLPQWGQSIASAATWNTV